MKQRHKNDERVIMTLSLVTFLSDTGSRLHLGERSVACESGEFDQLLHRESRNGKTRMKKVWNIT